jgi:hypothetical protein
MGPEIIIDLLPLRSDLSNPSSFLCLLPPPLLFFPCWVAASSLFPPLPLLSLHQNNL